MEFKYWVYLIALILIILMIIYTIVTYVFSQISLKKHEPEIEYYEEIKIPNLEEFGNFWVDEHLERLSNNITLKNYNQYMNLDLEYVVSFTSDNKQISNLQLQSFNSLLNYSYKFYDKLINSICDYYNEYYYDENDNDWNTKMIPIRLKKTIELNSIIVNKQGKIGLSFYTIWDGEHGLGILIEDNKIIDIGGIDITILF